uniref:sterile alpha motif domain-containing protein 9-like n=1 Tax=Centroberyx gerrardi TaxID=166262 RepID=UPI003AABFF2F
MASYTEPSLSTAKGGQIYMGSEITDSLPHLDVLYANEFEGEYTDPEVAEQTEENFYRGAPPEWLNFHTAEQAESEGTGTAFVKRDGYDKLVHQIHKRRRGPRTWTVKLLHQPGSGGTTLAMQVLWDLRKTFRSAVLTGPTSDLTAVANEVIHLFTAGRRGHQNTVLLLLQDEQIVDSLQDSIMAEIATQEIVTHMPVVILLNCVRKVEIQECDHVVLKKELSDTEKQKFKEKKKELSRRYRDKHKHFHGFNIMQTNFSQAYVQKACAVFTTVRRMRKPRETQLAACLALLNAYVPGSYLLESQCLDFLNQKDSSPGDLSLEERMEHFSHLIITFPPDINYERNVRMAHPMIAQQCTELMAEAGVTRSDTARHFLNCLCRDEVSPCLLGFAKDMLTKREMKKEENQENLMKRKEGHRGPKRREEDQEKFSRLILDIQKMEDNVQSASVLKVASKIFVQNPFFPQALARFYSLELKNYNRAEMWAKRAKERDPKNSFIADTLGQVYKHHLNSKASSATPREILRLATRAIEAFKDEERLAENQQGLDMQEDGMTKVSNIFNNRGLFGYLQVANIVFESLVNCNKDWRKVLTKNVSLGSVLKSLGDNKLWKFNALINSFRDEVERKCAFFDTYLTYSKPGMKKDDPPYIWRDVSNCYQNYVGDSPPKHLKQNIDKLFQCLKEKRAVTFPGLLSCLDRKYTVSQFKEITTWWGEIYLSKQCSDYAVLNYILAKIMLHNIGEAFPDALIRRILIKKMPLNATEPPELHMLAALMFWPKDKESIQQMHCSYEHAYKKHFRSRYLRPLFFLGKGKGLSRIIHKSILDDIFCEGNEDRKQDLNKNWSKIFKHLRIQERLLKIHGVVRNYKVYATFGDTEIEVDADLRDSLWKSGQVSFYLGFTIRGPVAFDIQEKPSKPTEEGKKVNFSLIP